MVVGIGGVRGSEAFSYLTAQGMVLWKTKNQSESRLNKQNKRRKNILCGSGMPLFAERTNPLSYPILLVPAKRMLAEYGHRGFSCGCV